MKGIRWSDRARRGVLRLVLRMPLASVMIATLLSARAGLEVAPLVVIAVVVAYLASEALSAYVDARIGGAPAAPAATAPGSEAGLGAAESA